MKKERVRRHADFQDAYRRSSNFRSVIKKEKLELKENGEVILNKTSINS